MRVLVTGGAGMLGSHLIRRLVADPAAGFDVVALDRTPMDDVSGATTVVGDVRDRRLIRGLVPGVDVIVHCAAALPSHRRDEIWSVDVDGTRCLLEEAARRRVGRFVHVSSTAVYGLPTVVPTVEEHPLEPVDPYSRAKAAAERLCVRYRERGMCVPVLRPKTFLGPGRLGLFAMLFEWAADGRSFPLLGGGRVRSQMLDVADLCDVVLACVNRPADRVNDVFNVGATEFGLLRDEFQAVLDAAGHGRRIVSIPAGPALGVLRGLELLRLSPVYQRLAHKLRRDSYVSTGKAESTLGFAPRYSNTASLLRTYGWYRAMRADRADGADRASGPRPGRTHREPWRQGALGVIKAVF